MDRSFRLGLFVFAVALSPACVVPLPSDPVDDGSIPRASDDRSARLDGGLYADVGAPAEEPESDTAPFVECGNGWVEPGEDCDDGIWNSGVLPDTCRTDCRVPWCGDGVVDDGEECDDGSERNSDSEPNACREDCREPVCGDGVVDDGEDCDGGAFCTEECVGKDCGSDADCDDGLFCNGGERCSAEGRCELGDGPADDGQSCTTMVCDEETDSVRHRNDCNYGASFCDGSRLVHRQLSCVGDRCVDLGGLAPPQEIENCADRDSVQVCRGDEIHEVGYTCGYDSENAQYACVELPTNKETVHERCPDSTGMCDSGGFWRASYACMEHEDRNPTCEMGEYMLVDDCTAPDPVCDGRVLVSSTVAECSAFTGCPAYETRTDCVAAAPPAECNGDQLITYTGACSQGLPGGANCMYTQDGVDCSIGSPTCQFWPEVGISTPTCVLNASGDDACGRVFRRCPTSADDWCDGEVAIRYQPGCENGECLPSQREDCSVPTVTCSDDGLYTYRTLRTCSGGECVDWGRPQRVDCGSRTPLPIRDCTCFLGRCSAYVGRWVCSLDPSDTDGCEADFSDATRKQEVGSCPSR